MRDYHFKDSTAPDVWNTVLSDLYPILSNLDSSIISAIFTRSPGSVNDYAALTPMIGDTYSEKHIRRNCDEVLRFATSIRQGTVTAWLILRKLGSYPRRRLARLRRRAR